MADGPEKFLRLETIQQLTVTNRFVALLWWHSKYDTAGVEFSELCREVEEADYSSVNKSRERGKLRRDKRTIVNKKTGMFKSNVRATTILDECYLALLDKRSPKESSSLLEWADFEGKRRYIDRVVNQINVSYDEALYDCCLVMLRRLVETFLIEGYENLGRADDVKRRDGCFMQLGELIAFVRKDEDVNFGRNDAYGTLENLKRAADKSAHDRRFNANRDRIDGINGLQDAITELSNWAFR